MLNITSIQRQTHFPIHDDYRLLQLNYLDDNWKMMVSCILLNRTKRKQVDEIIDLIFLVYPTPQMMASARWSVLKATIAPLGLAKGRAVHLLEMSHQFCAYGEPQNYRQVLEYDGLGQYASDSWRIFVDCDIHFNPKDVELDKYVRFLRKRNMK